ncbi:H-NS family nucleoid-associated regulatory protein [Burkholderia ubonensis]|uniref:H-NS histone family protein n=1 Tax=Burkholderia ubonensis TaxID=101571 RepID=UPI001E65C68F|nr:H-NS histone family protein [Burkholderia ubonensis]
MENISKMFAQFEDLDREIREAKIRIVESILEDILISLRRHGVTPDILIEYAQSKRRSKAVLPKYWNPDTGETWSGRGREPKWIAGKERSKYLIRDGQSNPILDSSRT